MMARIKGQELGIAVTQILDDYSKEVVEVTNEEIKQVAKEAVATLKATSPVRARNSKGYAKSWTSKKKSESFRGVETHVIFNRQGMLTHLLENGHVIRNKYGTYGRTRKFIHIKPVEDWAKEELPKRIERKLSR